MIPTFIRAYAAASAVAGARIVAFADPGTSQEIEQATASTDPILGVSDRMGAATGGMCDVHRAGLVAVELGGTVQAGQPVTAGSDGRAVAATAAAGQTRRIVGFADQPGVAGDIIDIWLAQGLLHQPA